MAPHLDLPLQPMPPWSRDRGGEVVSKYITDEMIEKAAIATYEEMQRPNWLAPLWDEIDEPGQERFLNAARAALETAAPAIAAQALRDFDNRTMLPREWHERVLADALRIKRGEL